MCGIAGEIRFDSKSVDLDVTKLMCDAQIHRGPDDDGYYAKGPVSLGIRRLAIIDLRKGLYPLTNEDETIQFVFNGEIYGFAALRKELEEHGHTFRTNTDAETVVHSYEEWGTSCLDKLNGMFAFALWDETKQLLWIARDHFGIKPLYYYTSKDFLTFASEIKPILARHDVSTRPNGKIVRDYVRNSRVDATEETFFEGIKQLRPAHHLLIRPNGTVILERYWAPKISRELDGNFSVTEIEETRRLFLEAVTKQLVSDVPVGSCLSGGIDSSSVVVAVRKVHPKGSASTGEWIRTFSSVFPGDPVDESVYAAKICKVAGAEQNPVEPTAYELWRDLPELVRCQEEPFGSTSIYAQFRVMKRAKERGITVLLDGQGGDELLCGYVPLYLYYLLTLGRDRKYFRLLVEAIRSFDLTAPLIRPQLLTYTIGLLRHVKSLISKPRSLATKPQTATQPRVAAYGDDLPGVLESLTSEHGLPALLRYEDKNSMWHSVEARVPFLDRPFFEYVASLPLDRKLHDGWTKYIFRCAMTGILPEEIRLRRSKIGFETPQKRWLVGQLRGQIREFFSKRKLLASAFYDPQALLQLLVKPRLTDNQIALIWRILNLELWYQEFFGSA